MRNGKCVHKLQESIQDENVTKDFVVFYITLWVYAMRFQSFRKFMVMLFITNAHEYISESINKCKEYIAAIVIIVYIYIYVCSVTKLPMVIIRQ